MSDAAGPGKVRRAIGAAILCAILLWFGWSFAQAWLETRGAVYFVDGTARSAVVRYTNERGEREQHEVRVPWTSRNVRVTSGTRVSIDALPGDNGTVSCRINFDANFLASQRESDVGVLCTGFAP